jgi:hypothetical protein
VGDQTWFIWLMVQLTNRLVFYECWSNRPKVRCYVYERVASIRRKRQVSAIRFQQLILKLGWPSIFSVRYYTCGRVCAGSPTDTSCVSDPVPTQSNYGDRRVTTICRQSCHSINLSIHFVPKLYGVSILFQDKHLYQSL